MNAGSIKIECEEDGFYLVIVHEPVEHSEWIKIEDPEALYDHVRAAIEPWLMERNAAKAEYDRAQRQSDTRNLSDEEFSAYLDDAYGDNWAKRVGMEQARESGHA